MPLWLRRFTYHKIQEFYEKKNEKVDTVEQSIKNMKSVGAVSNNKIQPPTYVTKASKK